MKKAVIITPFYSYSYNVRIKYIEKYLYDLGYDCKIISSNFDHRKKQQYKINKANLELVDVPKYSRNISFQRIYSHYRFAHICEQKIEEINPELVYVSGPPNMLFKSISKYKRKYNKTKVIFEIGDMWPEALPVGGFLGNLIYPFLFLWKYLRDSSLKYANIIICECELFRKKLAKHHINVHSQTIYLCKLDFFKEQFIQKNDNEVWNIAYVGSVNNIIDINLIINILNKINCKKRIRFVLIGDGESKDKLIYLCELHNVDYIDYGIVYDDSKKFHILNECQFGLNIMKENVVVGATMKSLEYFHWGLILINNIAADTEDLVERYSCGFNIRGYSEELLDNIIDDIVSLNKNDIVRLRNNSRAVYENFFDEKIIKKQFYKIINDI